MASDGFSGLTLAGGGGYSVGFGPFGSYSGTLGGYVTAFGGGQNNGVGVYGSLQTDRFSAVPSWSLGVQAVEQFTLTYGNAGAFTGQSAYYGAHILVAGLQVGVPLNNPGSLNGYSITLTLGPGFSITLGQVGQTVTAGITPGATRSIPYVSETVSALQAVSGLTDGTTGVLQIGPTGSGGGSVFDTGTQAVPYLPETAQLLAPEQTVWGTNNTVAPSVFDTGTQAVPFYQETQNPGQILGGDQSQPAQLDLPEGATLLGPTNGPDGVTAGGIPIISVDKYTVPEGYYTYDAADGNTYAVPLPSGTGYDQAPIGGQPMPSGDSMGKGGAGNDSLPAFTDPLGPTPTNDGFNPTNDGSSSSYPTNVGSYPGSFGGGYGGYGGGGYYPIVLDLTGKGINIQQLSSSNTFFDMAGEGHQHLTAWAGAGNGVLFYDPTGTGQLTQANQIIFTDWDPTAHSDMQALLDVFDTNHDGALDAGDANFADFFVMETNADGTQTAVSLASLGITSIDLNQNATQIALPDGSAITGETTYTTSGGTGTAATVRLAADPIGVAITSTTTTNGDGSVTIDNTCENADGSVAYQRILNTLIASSTSNGITTTTTNRTLSTVNAGGVVATLHGSGAAGGNCNGSQNLSRVGFTRLKNTQSAAFMEAYGGTEFRTSRERNSLRSNQDC